MHGMCQTPSPCLWQGFCMMLYKASCIGAILGFDPNHPLLTDQTCMWIYSSNSVTQVYPGYERSGLWYVIIVHHTEVHKRHSCTLWICRIKWAIFKKLLIIDFLNWQKAIWNNCSRVLKFQHSARLWQVHTAKLHTNLWLLPHRWMWHKCCWCPRKTTDTKNYHLPQNYT